MPRHVLTADYFHVAGGTKVVPADTMARYADWAEVPQRDTTTWQSGMKLLMYSDPNRAIHGAPWWSEEESAFAHDCAGQRISRMYPTRSGGKQQFLLAPGSTVERSVWRAFIARYFERGHFTAVFDDDVNNLAYMNGLPCNFNAVQWLDDTAGQIQSLGYPVVYNGLEPSLTTNEPSTSIALNRVAIGGMMEDCYSHVNRAPADLRWRSEENTEIAMAEAHKLFFCYGNDTGDAAASLDRRMYEFGSFLLTYNPTTTVLWEHWSTPTLGHIMPESGFVPLQPVRNNVRSVDQLRVGQDLYARSYYRCYLNGALLGNCAVIVNSSSRGTAGLPRTRFRHALQIEGSGVFDGGRAFIGGSPPGSLAPRSATIELP